MVIGGIRISRSSLLTSLIVLTIAGYAVATVVITATEVPNRLVTVPFRAVIAIVAVLLIGWSLGKSSRPRSLVWLGPFGLFWFLYVLRLIATTADAGPDLSRPIGEFWLYAIGTCLLPAIAVTLGAGVFRADVVRKTLTAVLFGVVSMLVLQGLLSGAEFGVRQPLNPHLNPISVAHLSVALLLVTSWAAVVPGVQDRGRIWLVIASALLVLWVQSWSMSRGPLLVLVLGLMLILVKGMGRRGAARTGLVLSVVIGSWWLVRRFFPSGPDMFFAWTRFTMTGDRLAAGRELRTDLWGSALRGFSEAPWTGIGLEDPAFPGYPHNMIVEALMVTGIWGGVAVLVLVVWAMIQSVRLILTDNANGWVGLLGVQMILWAQFSGGIYTISETWLTMALVFSVSSPSSIQRRAMFVGRERMQGKEKRLPDRAA